MLLIILFLVCNTIATATKYKPTWDSIDSRPLPEWYDDSKFGIFMHWGVYSVPAYRSEWIWWYWKGETPDPDTVRYIEQNYPPGTTYADFGKDFRAELFNADNFKELVEASGARYFVITSKHHEGFTMWPSRTSFNWNSVDLGPKRDVIGELKKAFSKSSVHFGLYFSLFEWFHPLYLNDRQHNKTDYVKQICLPQLIEIVNEYEPELIWSDGDWNDEDTYWRSKQFLAWLYNESPVKKNVVVNDRWGKGIPGKHGGFMTYADHFDPGHLLPRKWENCMTMDKASWGHRRTMKSGDVRTVHEVIEQLARTISCGGNLLLNVGPDMHGVIAPIFEQNLRELGQFVKTNSEAIFGTKPWIYQNDTNNIWYTSRLRTEGAPSESVFNIQDKDDTIVYAWLLNINTTTHLLTRVKTTSKTQVGIIGCSSVVKHSSDKKGHLVVDLSNVPWFKLPRTDVIVLKIEYAATKKHNPLQHHYHKNVENDLNRRLAYDMETNEEEFFF